MTQTLHNDRPKRKHIANDLRAFHHALLVTLAATHNRKRLCARETTDRCPASAARCST